ncbi:Cis-zeatin O-glucosyltransferase 2 [Triticum urartu]|uniref:Cis-zeatin O-glucosyltransferase 2 n=1 Tax=Triticum urartu TaxID=4572 RepID=M7ZNH2_TRIUA|nr:Cis-zeatin O-glucosyltransferase 2 [Triticum urartu]
MESMSHGKPILAWPMHCDQPWDAELVCNYLKAGVLVRPWEKHGEVVTAKAIQEVIEEAMLSDKGMAMRQRASALGEAVRASVVDGGSSRKDLDDFTAHITSSSLREEQAAELAAALHGSKQRFIWVLRDADRGDIFTDAGDNRHAELLSQFTKQTEGMGLVITGWAPQLEILAHRATAAFMSHCGWNSTMESMSHGKPILAWPMHSDQPWDAELVCSYLKAGLLVRPWEKHGEVIPATTIQEAIETMMVAEEGLAVRQRAEVLGEAVRSSAAQGGSSHKEMDDFISYMTRYPNEDHGSTSGVIMVGEVVEEHLRMRLLVAVEC